MRMPGAFTGVTKRVHLGVRSTGELVRSAPHYHSLAVVARNGAARKQAVLRSSCLRERSLLLLYRQPDAEFAQLPLGDR